jgi:uncharacterized DUF497 family protein
VSLAGISSLFSCIRGPLSAKHTTSSFKRSRPDNARVIPDPEHSEDEERFVLLGLSIPVRVLVVCQCYRQRGNVIRIISARKADTDEINQYR